MNQKHTTVIMTVRMMKPRARAILITMTIELPGELKAHNSYFDYKDDKAKTKGDTVHNDHRASW